MKKDELVSAIAESTDLSKADADRALKAAVDAITGAVASGDKVQIPGLGTFEPRERSGSTEADLPANGSVTRGDPLAAALQLERQASQGSSYPACSSEPAPRHPQRSTMSSSDVLLKPCQWPAGVKITSPASDGASPSSV